MAVYTIERFEVRADSRDLAEQAMHELATYVRAELPGSMWTTYRDVHAPHRFVAITRSEDMIAETRRRDAPGSQAFAAALAPILVGAVDAAQLELVTSSDLAPRHRPGRGGARRRPR
jgi:quinol monooxygenase YgiN